MILNIDFSSVVRRFVARPVIEWRAGRPVARFTKIQFWAYPELCRAQLQQALSQCDAISREKQLRLATMYFGPAIVVA